MSFFRKYVWEVAKMKSYFSFNIIIIVVQLKHFDWMIPYSLQLMWPIHNLALTILTMWTRHLCDFWLRKVHHCRCYICAHVVNDVVDVSNIQHFILQQI